MKPLACAIALLVFSNLWAGSARGQDKLRAIGQVDNSQKLLEKGRARNLKQLPTPGTIKLVSYNIRWRGGEDLDRLIDLFRTNNEIGGAAILGLQEVDRNKKRTGNVDTAKKIAEELRAYYCWAAPPPSSHAKEPQEEETGV